MKASLLAQVLEQYKAFCSLSRRDKMTHVGLLLLCLPLVVAAVIWLPRLYDSQPWVGPSLCALLFIHWMWHRGYPALKRRITEGYREIATAGLRQVPALCKRTWNDPGLFGTLFRLIIILLLLYPFAIVFRAVLPIIFNPIFVFTLLSVCSLAFIHWVWRRAYPALQQKLGPTVMRYVYAALVAATGGMAFVFARLYLNTLTGVDPGNFPKALTALTTFAFVPASIFTIALIAALISFGLMMAMFIDMVWCELHNHWQQFRAMWRLSRPQAWFLPSWRIMVNLFGAFGVMAFCAMLVAGEVPPINRVVRVVAAYTLVATEFSYDHTCPASSKERLVARLKDFKEIKPPRVLFAGQSSWGEVHFSIGTCE
jgi:hypothetical protein